MATTNTIDGLIELLASLKDPKWDSTIQFLKDPELLKKENPALYHLFIKRVGTDRSDINAFLTRFMFFTPTDFMRKNHHQGDKLRHFARKVGEIKPSSILKSTKKNSL